MSYRTDVESVSQDRLHIDITLSCLSTVNKKVLILFIHDVLKNLNIVNIKYTILLYLFIYLHG